MDLRVNNGPGIRISVYEGTPCPGRGYLPETIGTGCEKGALIPDFCYGRWSRRCPRPVDHMTAPGRRAGAFGLADRADTRPDGGPDDQNVRSSGRA